MHGSMQNFCKGGGDEVAVFKKGVAASSVRGSTGGGKIYTGGGGGEFLPPPLNTPLHMVSSNHTLKSK